MNREPNKRSSTAPLPPDFTSLESDLLQRSLDGDGRAFASLVRPHLPLMLRIAHRYTGNDSLAQDAVQESMTRLYQGLKRYQAGTSFRAWFASITTSVAYTMRRSEIRRRKREQASDMSDSQAGSAESEARAHQLERTIRDTLASMPKKRRIAATLRLDGRLSYSEIAETLSTTENSARVLVSMAMKDLKKVVSHWNETGEVLVGG